MIRDGCYDHNARLPPERELSAALGVTRSALRLALVELEDDGLIWRHVGRGTFVGARPVLNLTDVAFLRELSSPEQVISARIAIEPELARRAARHGSKADVDEMISCAARCRKAETWRNYEAWDNRLHDAIAKATHNKLLMYLFETLNVVRRSAVWGQPRSTPGPLVDHFSFAQHDAIIEAIIERDDEASAARMRQHLKTVRSRVLPALNR